MKHYLHIAFALICTLGLISCGDDNDDELDGWKAANEQAFNTVKASSGYKELKSPGSEGSLYYKVLKEGTGTKPIYYSSTVSIYSKGWFAEAYKNMNITKGDVFQRWEFDDGIPYTTVISSSNYLIQGVKAALQNMHQGDKWEIWIPCQLAGGSQQITLPYDMGMRSSTYVTIPSYSTLVFEIEVVEVR